MRKKLKKIVNPLNQDSFYILENDTGISTVLSEHHVQQLQNKTKISPQNQREFHKTRLLSAKYRSLSKKYLQVLADNRKMLQLLKALALVQGISILGILALFFR